ncbi:MAG: mannosyltransferase [Actinomycetes bacterium]
MRTSIMWSSATKLLLLLSLLAGVLSFVKFDHCINSNWATPDVDIHACYSDIPSLFTDRGLNTHQWAYSNGDKAIEYPVVMGAIMWATTWLTPAAGNEIRNYFYINALLLLLLFVGVVLLIGKMRPKFAYLLPVAPAVIGSLFINWDMWGIITMILAIYYFDRHHYSASAIALAVSIATKFFPVLLLLPILFIFWKGRRVREASHYLLMTVFVWFAINAPVFLTTPKGWWRFYDLNLNRDADWGSIWYALSLLGINMNHLNYFSILSVVVILLLFLLFLADFDTPLPLAQVSFILIASVLCVGKVYSPQYVLWLAPLAILALRDRRDLPAFWIWQGGEAVYHVAIWQHLALVSGAHFGLPDGAYAIATLIRIAATLYFLLVLVRRALKNPSQPRKEARGRLADFLFGTAESYP